MATLKLSKRIKGKIRGKSQIFRGDSFLLGSDPQCDIHLDSEFISEVHGEIFFDGGFFLRDKSSLTGIYVEGKTVEEPLSLQEGQRIFLGEDFFTVEITSLEELHLIRESHKKPQPLARELVELPEDRKWKFFLVGFSLILGFVFPLFGLPLFFSSEDVMSTGPMHKAHLEKGAPMECSKCHAPFGGTPREKCAACHKPQSKTDVHGKENQSCIQCHFEHRGRKGVVTAMEVQACWNCHLKAHKKVAKSLESASMGTKTILFPYPSFSHKEHLQKKDSLSCRDCHKVRSSPWEFYTPDYYTCVSCHTHKSWRVSNHNKRLCLRCHTKLRSPEWKRTQREFLQITSSKITQSFHSSEDKKCAVCHRKKQIFQKKVIRGKKFSHKSHLTFSSKSPQDCLVCHQTNKLGRMSRPTSTQGCVKCHRGRMTIERKKITYKAFPFPHKIHVALIQGKTSRSSRARRLRRRGCQACHTPNAQGEFSHLPNLKICSSCHRNHTNLGFQKCSACHRGLSNIFAAKKAFALTHKSFQRFSHKTTKHKKLKCIQCHQGTDGASNLLEISLPKKKDKVCIQCHLNLKGSKSSTLRKKLKNCFECHKYHEKPGGK